MFTQISKNEWVSIKPAQEVPSEQCTCDQENNCSFWSKCSNREKLQVCPEGCHLGTHCTNQFLSNPVLPRLLVLKTENMGRGLFAADAIRRYFMTNKSGTFLGEFTGEIYKSSEFEALCSNGQRTKQFLIDFGDNYVFFFINQKCIDASRKGNMLRFVNHACGGSNAHVLCVLDEQGEKRICFFASSPIESGNEIFVDYGIEYFHKNAMFCYCGAAKCIRPPWQSQSELSGNMKKSKRALQGPANQKLLRHRMLCAVKNF